MPKLIGWSEWVSLPELDVDRVKVKVDTGARTSAVHAFGITSEMRDGQEWVSFSMHPLQENTQVQLNCTAVVKEHRKIRDSGGHEEVRVVIDTSIELGGERWPIELTLTDREHMDFRMLLGRNAIKNRFYVDPHNEFLLTSPETHQQQRRGVTQPPCVSPYYREIKTFTPPVAFSKPA